MSERASVVVCAHDEKRWEVLQLTLDSLAAQSRPPDETILVIDHNKPLFERARTELAGVIVVENTDHRGLGGARNSGIEHATGSIVAFIDDDARASAGWVERLLRPYADQAVAGVGGGIEPDWQPERPAWFPPEFDWVVGCSYIGMPQSVQTVRNLIGCNMSYRRDVLESLGRFRLGYGCDETELCIRLTQRWPERRLVYVPEAKVFHRVGVERAAFGRFLSRCYFEGGSKAVVSRLVGSADGLSSERDYVRRVLPHAVTRGVGRFIQTGDVVCVARAGAILAGLAATTAGYVAGRLRTEDAARRRGWAAGSFP